ncbi:MAG: response regulator [Bacteroidota bacterium]
MSITKLENSGKKILIVDDSELIHYILNNFFKNSSFELIHAHTGKEAVKLFKENNDIKVILLDVELPDISGFEVAKYILSISSSNILMQTGSLNEGFLEKMKKYNLNNYIIKPYSKTNLIKSVIKLI